MLANAVARAAGMPAIVLAAGGNLPAGAAIWVIAMAVLVTCAAAGAIPGRCAVRGSSG